MTQMLGLQGGLQAGVGGKGIARFLNFNGIGKIGERFELKPMRREKPSQLAELFTISRAENKKASHGGVSRQLSVGS